MTHTDQSRAEFEKWARGESPSINLTREGNGYRYSLAETLYDAWHSSRATTEQSSGVELPEPAGEIISASCKYASVEWLGQTSDVGGGDPKNSRSWPITGDKLYTEQQVRALLTAAPAVPQGWKPIESAPKDGSEILLTSRKGRVANGCWMTANNRCGAWLWAYIKQEPTHWMPLPQPPKEQT